MRVFLSYHMQSEDTRDGAKALCIAPKPTLCYSPMSRFGREEELIRSFRYPLLCAVRYQPFRSIQGINLSHLNLGSLGLSDKQYNEAMRQSVLISLLPLLAALTIAVPVGKGPISPLARRHYARSAAVGSLYPRRDADTATTYTTDKRTDADTATTYNVGRRHDADTATTYTVDKRHEADTAVALPVAKRTDADTATTYTVDKRTDADTATTYNVDKRTDADTATTYNVDKRHDADTATTYTID